MAKIYDQLSEKAKQELSKLVNNKQNAVDMIVSNFYSSGEENYSSSDICSRFQVQYFAQNPNLNTLQEDGKEGWWQNEAYEPSSVNGSLSPIIETPTTVSEWGKKFYSSFALKEVKESLNLRYPLVDDYAAYSAPFADGTSKEVNFKEIVSQIESKLGVTIKEGDVAVKSLYKRNKLVLTIAKIKNVALKLAKRTDLIETSFKGTMVLGNKIGKYKFSNTEKIVKIYDEIFRVGIAKQLHTIKSKTSKKASKEIKFISRLFADLLMARITDYGDSSINKKVEKCISLQFANVLNRYPQSAEQMKVITALGTNVVADTCKRLGLTKEKIIQKMVSNGYQYPKVPNNLNEAILLAHEKDYSLYEANLQQEINKTEDENRETITKITSDNNTQEEKLQEEKNSETNLLEAPKIAGLLPKGNSKEIRKQHRREKILKKAEAMIEDEKRLALAKINAFEKELNQNSFKFTTNTERIIGEYKASLLNPTATQESSNETQISEEMADKFNQVNLEFGEDESKIIRTSDRIIREYKANNELLEKYSDNKVVVENSNAKLCNLSSERVTKRFVEKTIDKSILTILSEKVLSITNYLNAHRYSLVGGKEEGTKNAEIYSNVLTCYQKGNTTKPAKDNGTMQSRAKSLCDHLISVKNKLVEKILDGNDCLSKYECEKSITAVNRRVKELTAEEGSKGLTVREFFKKYLERLPKLYSELEKIDEKTN